MNKIIEWHQFLLEHPALHTILRKMCRYVDKNLTPFDLRPWTKNWYHKYQWTDKQQEAFAKWAIDYIYNNSLVRKELMNVNIKNKKMISEVVRTFILNYGWKVK